MTLISSNINNQSTIFLDDKKCVPMPHIHQPCSVYDRSRYVSERQRVN